MERTHNTFPTSVGREIRIDAYPGVGVGGLSERRELLRTDDSWHDSVPWSIALDIVGTGADGIADAPGALADVSWGVGGARHRAYVDWRRGQRFCIAAAQVDVTLLLRNHADWFAAPFVPQGYPATFRATMTPNAGNVPGVVPPTCTVPMALTLNSGGVSPLVTIPPFARRWSLRWKLALLAVGDPQIEVEWFAGVPTANQLVCEDVFFSNATIVDASNSRDPRRPAPVPCEATLVQVRNTQPPIANLTNVVMEFELGL